MRGGGLAPITYPSASCNFIVVAWAQLHRSSIFSTAGLAATIASGMVCPLGSKHATRLARNPWHLHAGSMQACCNAPTRELVMLRDPHCNRWLGMRRVSCV
eukprot:107169-Alexandrium_andersonii.AAC.1